jgi:hypothetical protein
MQTQGVGDDKISANNLDGGSATGSANFLLIIENE